MSVLCDLMYLLNTDAKLLAVLNVTHMHNYKEPHPKIFIKKKDPRIKIYKQTHRGVNNKKKTQR